MGLFKRKKKVKAAPAPARKSQHVNGDHMVIEPKLDRKELLALVRESFPDAVTEGEQEEWLVWHAHSLRLTIEFGEMSCIHNIYNVQLLFIAQHPFFDEDMVESVAGMGKTPDDAMRMGTANFCFSVMPSLLAAFDCEGKEFIEADVMGEKHRFRVPCRIPALHGDIGKTPPTELFALIRDRLPQYLGTKHCYWVKLFSSMVEKEPICEVRINGNVSVELTMVLTEEVIRRGQTGSYVSDKEFVLLIQEDATYAPCPFTKQQVGELTFRALELMKGITDPESAGKIRNAIRALAPSADLGVELTAFLPEITAQIVLQLPDTEGLVPTINNKPAAELKRSQVRSYGYIEDAVMQYLRKQNPTEAELRSIIAPSSRVNAFSKAMQNGAKLEDLQMLSLLYAVDESYRVW